MEGGCLFIRGPPFAVLPCESSAMTRYRTSRGTQDSSIFIVTSGGSISEGLVRRPMNVVTWNNSKKST